jgi:hypothetical protein
MYNINSNLKVQESTRTTSIPVGIQENCKLTNVEKLTASNGGVYLQFTFEDAHGNTLKHIEWDVNPERVTPKPGETTEEAVARRVNSMLMRVKHICTKFVPENLFQVQGNNFGELCDGVIRSLGTTYHGKSVRLKVVYNWKDYSSLPNFCPFIETMDITDTKLRLTQYDKTEKSAQEAAVEVTNTDDSDLPF